MKKAINQWAFPIDWSWDRVFALCRELGFSAVELCIDYPPFFDMLRRDPQNKVIGIASSVGAPLAASKSLSFDSPDAELRRVGSLAAEHGLAVSSVLTMAQFAYPLVAEDESVRGTGIELVRRLLDFAEQLEAPNLLVLPGAVTPAVTYQQAYDRLTGALEELLPEAESRKIGLGLENVWGKFLYSPLEMRDLVDRFDSPYLGVHFDVGNVLPYGYPEQWIRILGPRLLSVHLKDYRESIGNIMGFTYLFQGEVAWDGVMHALREVDYRGYLIAEVPPYPFAPEEGVRDTARKMDLLLDGGS